MELLDKPLGIVFSATFSVSTRCRVVTTFSTLFTALACLIQQWGLLQFCKPKGFKKTRRNANHSGRLSPDGEQLVVVRMELEPTSAASQWTVEQHLDLSVMVDALCYMKNWLLLFILLSCLWRCCSRTSRQTEVPCWLGELVPLLGGDLSTEHLSDMML